MVDRFFLLNVGLRCGLLARGCEMTFSDCLVVLSKLFAYFTGFDDTLEQDFNSLCELFSTLRFESSYELSLNFEIFGGPHEQSFGQEAVVHLLEGIRCLKEFE
jgi:hypothetical protein